MKDYAQIIKGMTGTLWVMQEDSLQMIVEIVNRRLAGEFLSDEEIKLKIESAENGKRDAERFQVGGGLGILPLYGPMFPKANLMTEVSGATSMEAVRSDLERLVMDDSVKTIVLDIDSPGGTVDMTQETGEAILAARSIKPVYAVANSMACSGAHWLASMATKFYATPSGRVGSIGVLGLHEDRTEANAKQGRKVTLFTSGEYKATGHPDKSLSVKEQEYLQGQVDEAVEGFIDAVAAGRGVKTEVVKEWADGRIFSAAKAQEMGMIDGIKTLDSVVGELLETNYAPAHGSLAAKVNQLHAVRSHAAMAIPQLANTTNIDLRAEVADKEHAEPGSGGEGGEPLPRERESEPVRFHPQTDPLSDENNPEGSIKVEESELRAMLGIEDDTDIRAHIESLRADSEALNSLRAEERREQAFAEAYPEEARKLKELEAVNRRQEATAFADSFKVIEREGRRYAMPTPILEKLAETHLLFADGSITIDKFKEVITDLTATALPELGERGSTVSPESESDENMVKQFSEAIELAISESDGKLSRADAIGKVSKEHPEWYKAYREALPARTR